MPRYIGGLTAPRAEEPQRVDMTPDWMRSLLPDGGKVSLTVHGPTQAAATAPQPNAAVTNNPPQNPTAQTTGGRVSVPALRTTTPGAQSATTTGTTAPPTTTPTTNAPPDIRDPEPPAPGRVSNSNPQNHWQNPYTGAWEQIPGIGPDGKITDPNALWAYYSRYPSADLDAILVKLVGQSGAFATTPDYNALVTGSGDYLSGLNNINTNRWLEALKLGDPVLAQQVLNGTLTQAQLDEIANNPNSAVAQRIRALKGAKVSGRATAAQRGALHSGAAAQAIQNSIRASDRQQEADKQSFLEAENAQDKAQQDLFRQIMEQMKRDNPVSTNDLEKNRDQIWAATHKQVTAAVNNAKKALTDGAKYDVAFVNRGQVTNARQVLHALNTALGYGNMLPKATQDQLRVMIAAIKKRIDYYVKNGPAPKVTIGPRTTATPVPGTPPPKSNPPT